MKRTILLTVLTILLAVTAFSQTGTNNQSNTAGNSRTPTNKATKTKTVKPSKTMPTADADIQQCIMNKLAKAPKLSRENLSAAVSGGVATLSGNAPDSGSKGGASILAKSCGAKSVVNNITFTAKPKTPKDKKTNMPKAKMPKTNQSGKSGSQ